MKMWLTSKGTSLTSCNVYLKQAGTANVTASWVDDNGENQTAICAVTAENPEPFALDETKTITLNPGESAVYAFTPQESGNYILYQANHDVGFDFGMENAEGAGWRSDSANGNAYYNLVAGESYPIFVNNFWFDEAITNDITLVKCTATESFTICGDLSGGYMDEVKYFQVYYTPEFGASDRVTWSVNDTSIAEVLSDAPSSCDLLLKSAGTVTLTATSIEDSSKTASVEVTVRQRETIALEEVKQITVSPDNSTQLLFTPTEDGVYAVSMEANQPYWANWFNTEGEWLPTEVEAEINGRFCQFRTLRANTTYIVAAWWGTDEFGNMDCDITVNKATIATEMTLNDYQCYAGDVVVMQPVFGPGLGIPEDIADVTVSDEGIAEVTNVEGNNIFLAGLREGETTVTVTSVSGLSASATIKVVPLPALTLNTAENVKLDPQSSVIYTFTPEYSCYYQWTVTVDGQATVIYAPADYETDEDIYTKGLAAAGSDSAAEYMEADKTYLLAVGSYADSINATLLVESAHGLTKVTGTAATYTTPGTADHYKCSACSKLFSDAEGKTEVLASDLVLAADHDLIKVAAVEPTYDAAGNVEYYVCAGCSKWFADAEGKTETTVAAVRLTQLIKVEASTALVSTDAVEKAVEEADSASGITIDVSNREEAVVMVELPVVSLKALAEMDVSLTLITSEATVTLDATTMAAIAEAANCNAVTVKIERVETMTLNEKQQAAVAGKTVMITVSANIYSDGKCIGDFKGGNAIVSVPLEFKNNEKGTDFAVYYVADDGTLTSVECFYKNGQMHFTTGHFSDYVIVKTAENKTTEETKPGDPMDETEPEDRDVPSTGDNAHMGLMIALLLAAVTGMVGTAVFGKKYAYAGKWER